MHADTGNQTNKTIDSAVHTHSHRIYGSSAYTSQYATIQQEKLIKWREGRREREGEMMWKNYYVLYVLHTRELCLSLTVFRD